MACSNREELQCCSHMPPCRHVKWLGRAQHAFAGPPLCGQILKLGLQLSGAAMLLCSSTKSAQKGLWAAEPIGKTSSSKSRAEQKSL